MQFEQRRNWVHRSQVSRWLLNKWLESARRIERYCQSIRREVTIGIAPRVQRSIPSRLAIGRKLIRGAVAERSPIRRKYTRSLLCCLNREPVKGEARFERIHPLYLETLTLVERLHRRLLDVIKDEFGRRRRADINSVQALLLYNIGDKELTTAELRKRGYYLGSNVSYNLKKLVEVGFLDHQRSQVDCRSVRIKLTDKGREMRDIVDALYQKHVRTVEQGGGINSDEVATLNKSLHRLERFWTDQILYRL
jgi:DNA-binding MarR family transcriptional regulator